MNHFFGSGLLSSIIWLILGVFIYLKSRKNVINYTFSLFALSVATYSFGFSYQAIANSSYISLFWIRIILMATILIPVFFLQFIYVVLEKKIERKFLLILYTTCIIFEIINFSTEWFATNPIPKYIFRYLFQAGFLYPVLCLFFVVVITHAFVKLYKGYRIAIGFKKTQLKYLFWAPLIGFTGGSTGFLLGYNCIFLYPVIPVATYGVSTYGIVMAFAIFRYQLMGINIIIKKTTTYAAVIALVAGGYLAIIALSDYIFETIRGRPSPVGRIIAVIIVAAIFHPLRNKIEFIIDKVFSRGKLNYQEALAEFTRSLVSVLDLRELLNLIVSMSGILGTRQMAVFMFSEELNQFRIKSSVGLDKVAQDIEFDRESDLIKLLRLKRKIVLKDGLDRVAVENNYAIIKEEMDVLKAAIVVPMFIKNELKGILSLGEKLSGDIYNREDINLLQTLADEAGIAIENAQLYGDLKRTYLETVQALAQAIEASDEYTRGHSDRVTKLAIQIAKQLELSRAEIDTLKFACILHDIGKIGIIKEVLNKPDKLTEAEFNIIKIHPELGEEIIAPVVFLAPIKPTIRHHHERFDGRGYPDGLKGAEIPYLSRIIAVADTYDAMTSERPYRPALSTEIALAEIKRCAGSQFDPEIVKAFLALDHTI